MQDSFENITSLLLLLVNNTEGVKFNTSFLKILGNFLKNGLFLIIVVLLIVLIIPQFFTSLNNIISGYYDKVFPILFFLKIFSSFIYAKNLFGLNRLGAEQSEGFFINRLCFFRPGLFNVKLLSNGFLSLYLRGSKNGVRRTVTSGVRDIRVLDYDTRF